MILVRGLVLVAQFHVRARVLVAQEPEHLETLEALALDADDAEDARGPEEELGVEDALGAEGGCP